MCLNLPLAMDKFTPGLLSLVETIAETCLEIIQSSKWVQNWWSFLWTLTEGFYWKCTWFGHCGHSCKIKRKRRKGQKRMWWRNNLVEITFQQENIKTSFAVKDPGGPFLQLKIKILIVYTSLSISWNFVVCPKQSKKYQ